MLSPRPAEFSDGASVSHRPDGRESLGPTLTQGFTLGYFPILPRGESALNALLFPYLKLLEVRDGGDGRPIL